MAFTGSDAALRELLFWALRQARAPVRRSPLPVVTIKRARCPGCDTPNVFCRKSCGDQGDGSILWYAGCRECGAHFVLVQD